MTEFLGLAQATFLTAICQARLRQCVLPLALNSLGKEALTRTPSMQSIQSTSSSLQSTSNKPVEDAEQLRITKIRGNIQATI